MDRKPGLLSGLLLGIILGIPLAAVFYLGDQLRLVTFIPFDIFDWHSRVLPGGLITGVIDILIHIIRFFNLGPTAAVAKLAEQLIAMSMFVGITALAGLAVALVIRITPRVPAVSGGLVGGLLTVIVLLIELKLKRFMPVSAVFTAFLFIGWSALVGIVLSKGRGIVRILSVSLPLALTVTLSGYAVSRMMSGMSGSDVPLTDVRADSQGGLIFSNVMAVEKRSGILPAPGTRTELTPKERFFRVDIDTTPPIVNSRSWRMRTSGLFDRPRQISYADLMKYPEVTQPITLCCISNPVAGDLIGTVFFTGIRLRDFIHDLGIRKEAKGLMVRSVDGYYETVSQEDMNDPRTLLVYGMNGRTLTPEQGFPVRIYIPGRYGMKQPKWVISIEAISPPDSGFWVDRGWDREADVQTLSVIDTVAQDAARDGRIPIGGIAFAGGRGIKSVQIQVDDGQWRETEILNPPLGPLTWVIWRYDWPHQGGRHTFRVRAVDGNGVLQSASPAPPHPKGATGYHQLTLEIR
ncbi:MAG: molybdopterin-dependent oxidoreductase [Deltaproteobacteria bacterium]